MWPVTRGGARVRQVLPLVAAALLLTSCGGPPESGDPPAPVSTNATRTTTSQAAVTIETRMATHPQDWRTARLDGDARLEYTDSSYRMTAGGWPLVSPSMDPRAADLDPVAVQATIRPVSGGGLFGVACAVKAGSAYVFVVGHQPGDVPYYAIALVVDGTAQALVDSSATGAADAEEVVAKAGDTSVEGRCRSGPQPGTSVLELIVDDEVVLDTLVQDAGPDGQVGLVALSRSGGSLVVDVEDVTIRSPT